MSKYVEVLAEINEIVPRYSHLIAAELQGLPNQRTYPYPLIPSNNVKMQWELQGQENIHPH